MKALLVFALIAAAAFAEQGPEDQMDGCLKGCCMDAGGAWDGADNICDINETARESGPLSKCQLNCVYSTTGVEAKGPGCCAPAMMLIALAGAALWVRK
ncbi:MAG TPA: hypothetical protein VLD37_07260 [Candidatus Bilamarchaeum sp.]|nr:hypothetical protein [Candidatus Bilamarchaeum sp.]